MGAHPIFAHMGECLQMKTYYHLLCLSNNQDRKASTSESVRMSNEKKETDLHGKDRERGGASGEETELPIPPSSATTS